VSNSLWLSRHGQYIIQVAMLVPRRTPFPTIIFPNLSHTTAIWFNDIPWFLNSRSYLCCFPTAFRFSHGIWKFVYRHILPSLISALSSDSSRCMSLSIDFLSSYTVSTSHIFLHDPNLKLRGARSELPHGFNKKRKYGLRFSPRNIEHLSGFKKGTMLNISPTMTPHIILIEEWQS
jgi:hypothetical protein